MRRISRKVRSRNKNSSRRTTRRTRKSCSGLVPTKSSLSQKERSEALKVYINQIVQKKINSKFEDNRVPRETYKEYYLKMKKVGIDWLTIDALKQRVNRAFNSYVKASTVICPPPPETHNIHSLSSNISTPTPNDNTNDSKLGRPQGTTMVNRKKLVFAYAEAKNDITKMYYAVLLESRKNPLQGKVKEGKFQEIFESVRNKYKLPSTFRFSYHSVMKRISRGVLEYSGHYTKSPLRNVEYKFVQILLALADSGCPVSIGEGMSLLQSLIQDTPAQQKLIRMQMSQAEGRKTIPKNPTSFGKFSRSYYYGFLERYKDILEANKGRRFELNRTKWTNYRNFLHMYMDVEMLMVEAKLASKLDQPVCKDKANDDVSEESEEAYGLKVSTDLHLPQCCVVMDEVGSDLNMMNDGHLGGTKFITRRGNNAVINSTKKSKRFTVLGLTTLTGDPLMCVVIFEGKERNPLMESGIDIFHPLSRDFDGDISE